MSYKFLNEFHKGNLESVSNFVPIHSNRRPLPSQHSSRVNRDFNLTEKLLVDKTYCFFYYMERDGKDLMGDHLQQATDIIEHIAKLDSKSLQNPSLRARREMLRMHGSAIGLWGALRAASADPDHFDTQLMSTAMGYGTYHPVMAVLEFFESDLTTHRVKLLSESCEFLIGRLRKNIRAVLKERKIKSLPMKIVSDPTPDLEDELDKEISQYMADAYSHLLIYLHE